ncbi:DUF6049 family protein [Gordonia bronchialis]|uniref:DUF6049 family protein n=1 Tax=Gordonia bronchialis TaxID=2054 RepID=UPI001CBFF423|nr:DUF6049 family protein [Gordonia bronchialis]UAK36920.1 DUF6049 family protein [Gordonia bronchialis]
MADGLGRLQRRRRTRAPGRGVALLAALLLTALIAAPSTAQPAGTDERISFARIVVDTLTPTIVTTTSAPVVTVAGHVDNTSDRTVRDLTIRLERGAAVTSAAGLRSSLAVDHPPVAAAGGFRRLTDTLAPGGRADFTITMPLSTADGLQISRPGVYPLQVNVNGVPDYGSTAQVAGSRTLLPVLSLPPDADRASGYVQPATEDSGTTDDDIPGLGPDGSVSANLSSPARMTMLWPLAAPPQLAAGVLGAGTEPVRLISEDLARSLGDGGRLANLLAALSAVVGSPPPGTSGTSESTGDSGSDSSEPNSPQPPPAAAPLAGGLCLAIDPDLLVTVRAMSLGYVVSTDPGDPRSSTVEGTGSDTATRWLAELRRVASKLCVVALPFAQVDLTSLARVGNTALSAAALTSPADVVDAILGVRSIRNLAVPAVGAIDADGAGVLTGARVPGVAVSTGSIRPQSQPDDGGLYRLDGLGVATYEAPITAALGGLGTSPSIPTITPADQVVDLAAESDLSRRQAALAALAYPAISAPLSPRPGSPSSDDDAATPVAGRGALIVPPTYWSPTVADADALFDTARLLVDAGAASAESFPSLVEAVERARTPARLRNPPGVGPISRLSSVLTPTTTAAIRDDAETSWQLQGSLVSSADVAATPERYLSPLREDLLRAMRSPDVAGEAARAYLTGQQSQRVSAVSSTLQGMRSQVTILDPGGRYTLASERSPLLLVVRNDLDLPVRVKIATTGPADLDVGDVGVVEIPANGTRQIQLPTRAESSEATSVVITLSTVTGLPLGEPITLSLRSNAYGRVLFIVTIVAGVALVLLTARRLWHRFRGEPDPADLDRPEPDELERLLAGSSYQERRRTLQHEEERLFDDPPDPHADTGVAAESVTDTGDSGDTTSGTAGPR